MTAVFLLVFVVQLLIYGFHELTEANIFPYSEPLHWATEPYGPDGRYGQYLSYLLVMLPLGVADHQLADAAARGCRVSKVSNNDRLEFARVHRSASLSVSSPLHRLGARDRGADHDRGARARRVDASRRSLVHGLRLSHLLGGFAAPLFLWLAGLGLVLSAERVLDRSPETSERSTEAVVRRGAEIFILAFLFRLQAFIVSPGSSPVTLFRVDILNVMGPAMAVAGLIWASRRDRRRAAVACGLWQSRWQC